MGCFIFLSFGSSPCLSMRSKTIRGNTILDLSMRSKTIRGNTILETKSGGMLMNDEQRVATSTKRLRIYLQIYYSIYGNKNGAAEKPKTFGQHRLFRCIAL